MKDDLVQYPYKISILTPTFNRANTIHRVYESLLSQTYTNFEWIVIDDGSTDNTKEIIESYKKEKPFFDIIYSFKENSGVIDSLGYSIPFISGDFIVRCDSDDTYLPNMIEVLIRAWDDIPKEERDSFRGVSSPVMDENYHFFGKPLTQNFVDMNYLDFQYKLHRREERVWLERTDLWKTYNFEKGVSPKVIWYPYVNKEYKARFINIPLRIYYRNNPGNITHEKSLRIAYARFSADRVTLSYDISYFFYEPYTFFWRASNAWLYGSLLGYGPLKISRKISSLRGKIILWVSYPLGMIRRLNEKRKGRIWK